MRKLTEQEIIFRHNEIWKNKENPIILTGRYKNEKGVIGLFNETYNTTKTLVEYTCFLHGNFWHSVSKDLLGEGCKKCSYINMGKAYQKDLVGQKFDKLLVLKKIGVDSKRQECIYLVRCDCGKEFEILSGRLRNKKIQLHQCYDCGMIQIGKSNSICNNIEKSLYFKYPELLLEWDYEKNNKLGLDPKRIYPKTDKKAWWKNKECGHEWYTSIKTRVILNSGCSICTSNRKESKGATLITQYLNKNDIFYIKEYKIKDCKYVYSLFFDFAIFEDKEKVKLKYLIEFDGRQHYEAINLFGWEENLILIKKRDSTKNEYCKNNNINLIRIPYWEEKFIEEILQFYV